MRITRIAARGFRTLRAFDWAPTRGVNGIVGPNGTGKSTVLALVRAALTGEWPRKPKPKNLTLGWGEDPAWIALDFEHEGRAYQLQRGLKQAGTHLSAGPTRVDGETAVNQALEGLFRLPLAVLARGAFVPQDGIVTLLRATDADRVKFYGQLFELDQFEAIWEALGDQLRRLPVTPVADVAALLAEAEALVQQREQTSQALRVAVQAMETSAQAQDQAQRAYATAKQHYDRDHQERQRRAAQLEEPLVTAMSDREVWLRMLRGLEGKPACPTCGTPAEALAPLLEEARRQAAVLEVRCQDLRTQKTALLQAPADLTETLELAADAARRASAGHEQRLQDERRLAAEMRRLDADADRILVRLDQHAAQAEAAETRAALVAVLSEARDQVRRDQLPATIARAYLDQLCDQVNACLARFAGDFQVEVCANLDFECRVGDLVQPVADLSGGQQVMLALSLWVALNHYLAPDLGILCLDEPTLWLDAERRAVCVPALVESLRSTDLQVFLVTHDQGTDNVFDSLLVLDEVSACPS